MKARDIIPGWPKGRTTTKAGENDMTWKRWRLWALLDQVSFGFLRDSEEGQQSRLDDLARLDYDIRRDEEYHAQQQRMVDRFKRDGGFIRVCLIGLEQFAEEEFDFKGVQA